MAMLKCTSLEDIPKIHETARRAFNSGKTQSLEFRKQQIAQLAWLIKDHEDDWREALRADLGRHPQETDLLEFTGVYAEVTTAYKNIEKWAKPQSVDFSLNWFAMRPKLQTEPKGVVLIIAPFNLPLFLLLGPLTSAIAAGNAAVLKPSEQIPATSQLLAELLPKYLDNELYHVINGGVPETTKVCLSPEYVLVPADFQDTLVEALKEAYKSFYPDGPEKSDSFARMVSPAHAARIKRLIDETKGTIVLGGQTDVENRYIAPTVVRDVPVDDALMSEEIFGPVLPIVPVKDVDEAISIIQARDHPLAVYVFSTDKKFQEKVFKNTKSGSAIANDSIIHGGVPGLPVGGVGASGYGYYSSKQCFEDFSHYRTTMDNPSWVDTIAFGFRFPPYKPDYLKKLNALTGALPPRAGQKAAKRWGLWIVLALVGASASLLIKSGRFAQLKA
ncbi:hypothetical protein BN946_scf185010.g51 [Trametes cinnabarina]|uniref:Aldehyde dehydrogenase n=1 Tax=Pycnoporus cinnabarinus TaxID=5643 RepID=A0A060SLQ8_PYCCI|nr:hypothetical protein BN946_scf185010.g51 [Trametes cinnabarina]